MVVGSVKFVIACCDVSGMQLGPDIIYIYHTIGLGKSPMLRVLSTVMELLQGQFISWGCPFPDSLN
jgi:ABC-type Na+ transport system ATPase subunit NatA